MTRITDSMFFSAIDRYVTAAKKRTYTAQTQAQTGLKVNQPSDDPVAAARATLLDAQLSRLQTMDSTSARSKSQVDAAGNALDDAIQAIGVVRDAARNAASGTVDPAGMKALGTNVAQQRVSILADANTSTDQGYLFGGFLDATPPFQASGAYVGDAGVRFAEVAPGTQVQVNVSGAQAFTAAGGVDVLTLVDTVSTALANGDTATLQASLGNLDTALGQMKSARTQLAASSQAIATAGTTRAALQNQVQGAFDSSMRIDDATASVQLLSAQNGLQAATTMASSILSMLANLNR